MSGGSHGYVCYQIESELCDKMKDPELNDLIQDVANLAHDLEWADSGDIGEEDYKETVRKFKEKWFISSREDRLREYIETAVSGLRSELLNMIGADNH